ncbi:MAG: hypothetical protein CVU81_02585 [Euryarchaeota archaeon HGW-Euryarchaeota-1]|nr:MAG: hypothetical protein CVU81_02585 [Euryarchaeota archaeon HGW-Euryarchaeota-1]PKP60645.1 MAG: hypothetical protein CVT88_02430 [Candidatus Altiarchaeales archaeon HGW-Altiarchaeales-1]
MEKKFSSIGIVCNPNVVEKEKDFITDTLKAVQNFIKNNGEILIEHHIASHFAGNFLNEKDRGGRSIVKESNIKDMHCDMILVFGGDGTILHTINAVQDVPIIGINLGRFGFMTELNKNDAIKKLENLFKGNFFIENYDMLDINDTYNAVNEAVICYKFPARLLDFKIKINGDVIGFSADGVVIATPTGSTAYSLSLGGPVIHPSANAFVITPMNSFLGNAKPIVVPSDSEIFINIERANEDAFLIIDGKVVERIDTGKQISVKKSKKIAKFIRLEKTMRCAKIFKF